jgi:HlyD family secretion protein
LNKPVERRERLDIEAILGAGAATHAKAQRWRRLALIVGAVAFVAVAGWWLLGGAGSGISYETRAISKGGLVVNVTATGAIQPTRQVDVSSELSGTVRNVFVDYNTTVKAGDKLAELDTDKLLATLGASRAKLEAARAHVADAEANLIEKQRDLERKKTLAGKEFMSGTSLDLSEAAYRRGKAALDSARADVAVAEADLKLNETNLSKAVIISPIDGVVLSRNVDPGQTVAASFQAPVLFSIAENLRQMELQVDIDEADVGQVRPDQKATFTVDAFPGREFPARIRDVRFAPETIQGVVTYKGILEIDNSDLSLRPGMTATAEIDVIEVADSLLVPNAALRFRPPDAGNQPKQSFLRRMLPGPPQFRAASQQEESGPKRTVWVLKDGTPSPVSVVVGPSDGTVSQLISGDLAEGQEVVIDQRNDGN